MPRKHDAALGIAKSVLGGSRITLVHKPITMPTIATEHHEGAPEWTKQLGIMDTDEEWYHLYENLQRHRGEYWEKTVRAFEQEPGDFYKAYHYLDSHPAFYYFHDYKALTPEDRIHERQLEHDGLVRDSVTIMVVKCNPENSHIEEDETLNTKTEVWVELGKRGWPKHPTDPPTTWDHHWHDVDLDCGADTYEQAIITAAILVHVAYGNDRTICDAE